MSASHALVLYALVLYTGTAWSQQAGRAGRLDPEEALAKNISLASNTAPGEPVCGEKTAREIQLVIKAPQNFDEGLPSENIFLDGEPCSNGKVFEFLDDIVSPEALLRPNGYTLALSFLSGDFRAPATAGEDTRTSPPDDLDMFASVLRGDSAPRCGNLTLNRFFAMRPKKPFTIPGPVQSLGSGSRVIMEPNELYIALDAEGLLSPAPINQTVSPTSAELCLFGRVDTERETVASEERGGTEGTGGTESSSSGTPIAAIAAGVAGAVLGLVVIIVAAVAWRRRHVHASEGRLAEDFSVGSSREMSPI